MKYLKFEHIIKVCRQPALRLMVLIIVVTVTAGGCALLPGRSTYEQPQVTLPEKWQVQPETGEMVLAAEQWWKVFQDPELNRLITLVLETNNDLAAATIKVKKARLKAGLEDLSATPDLSVSASSGKKKDLDSGDRSESSSASIGLSWELDLWGKVASSRDSAEWEARATSQDRANTALALINTTADLYWQIAYLNQALKTSRESIEYTKQTLELVRIKYETGAVDHLDLLQAEQNLESQKADLADLEQQMAEARNALAVLFNQPPEQTVTDPVKLSQMQLPALQAGVPVSILANRPDLAAAEMRLRSLLADKDSTKASYYPSLSLTSSLGTSSIQLLEFLKNPVASLGVGLTLPFVQWRQMNLDVKIAEAEYEEAVAQFRQSLYEALQDVSNALSARKNYLLREKALKRSYELAREAEQVARVRYQAGKTGVQEWLDQQETLRNAELTLAKNRYNQLANMMTLYLALGGGSDNIKIKENQ